MKKIKIILLGLLVLNSLSVGAQDVFTNISGFAFVAVEQPEEKEAPTESSPNTNTLVTENQNLVSIAPCQVYSFATVTFNIPQKGAAILSIFDANGNKIKTIASDTFDKGQYSKVIRSRDLRKGTYYVKLDMDGYTETKKLTVVH